MPGLSSSVSAVTVAEYSFPTRTRAFSSTTTFSVTAMTRVSSLLAEPRRISSSMAAVVSNRASWASGSDTRGKTLLVAATFLDRIQGQCSQPPGRVTLVGLGGIGKSQLALEYVYRATEKQKDLWSEGL
ncbi:hypothetical protein CCM_00697 [Cordyceps militaris CM01]|uniref:NB-ARC domain-containing protein n=1 Tax=Cordyceps militaris (strain CM01) TaxID=983644 RepID=G3J5I1_CORMM|nr:uncharacterized protein CCM_00697 [Cordyceps militaris CM01]EGX96042.1 hypothetical protein CCM_00697 [Cordyceps militaris CM01]